MNRNQILLRTTLALSMIADAALFAQEAVPSTRDQGIQTFVMMGIALLFLYFILWRPEQKRRKILEDQRAKLTQGDRVTAMGIVGTVVRVQEHTVILKMYDGSKIEVLKGAITDVGAPPATEAGEAAENVGMKG